ncbi:MULTISPECIES: hypothetical protein [Nonomuraea]|uniref:Uncharacterized protein n=1 Tax=Nonomuraea ferruginea TaxID=46174 RepID=A0ABT4SYX1_9ACTN|nr:MULTISPECIES: hypothetical protein [Nonomuraea]MDA0642448.1 hypothetical protein [Nonomuraea ferruginea]
MVKNLSLLLAGLLAGVAIMLAGQWPRAEVVYRSEQPSTVTYEDDSAHHLGLIRRDTLFGDATHLLVVGRDPGFGYGHWVNVHTSVIDAGKEIAETAWTPEGVRVRFMSGHELFVPARYFLHGR